MKIGKLYIKGMRDPIELTHEQANKVQSVILNSHIKDKEVVEIADWAGRKEDLRYVKFLNVADEKSYDSGNKYSVEELIEFQKELQPYMMKIGDEDYERTAGIISEDIKSKAKLLWSIDLTNEISAIRDRHLNDEDVKKEAERITQERFLGKLANGGEMRYLLDKQVITLDKHKKVYVVQKQGGGIPYHSLNNKLSEYTAYVGRKDYGTMMQTRVMDDLAIRMKVESLQKK